MANLLKINPTRPETIRVDRRIDFYIDELFISSMPNEFAVTGGKFQNETLASGTTYTICAEVKAWEGIAPVSTDKRTYSYNSATSKLQQEGAAEGIDANTYYIMMGKYKDCNIENRQLVKPRLLKFGGKLIKKN